MSNSFCPCWYFEVTEKKHSCARPLLLAIPVPCQQPLNMASPCFRSDRGRVTQTVKDEALLLIIEPCFFALAIHLPLPGSLGHRDIQHRRPAALQREAGTMVPAGPYPGWGDTAEASLTNCPCLATWESGDCGNCIFPSNCICHMCGLLLLSQVWGPSHWCVKPNSWTLTCTARAGCARRGPR